MIFEKKACGNWSDGEAFLRAVIDALPDEIGVLDNKGRLVAANGRWLDSMRIHGLFGEADDQACVNPMSAARNAGLAGNEDARRMADGLEAVLAGAQEKFELEYPCRRGAEARWFLLRVQLAPFERGGALLSRSDITARRSAEEEARRDALRRAAREAFLVALADKVRPLSDAIEIQQTTCRLLAEHLDADRVYFADVYVDHHLAIVCPDYFREGMRSISGNYGLARFPEAVAALKTGRPFVLRDERDIETASPETRANMRALGIRAIASVPLLVGGRLLWTLSAASTKARDWAEDEVALIADVAARTWDAIKRALAITALRESEQREKRRSAELQAILDMAPIGLAIALDESGERIKGNRACEQIFGPDDAGALARDYAATRIFQHGRELMAGELPMRRAARGEVVAGEMIAIERPDGERLIACAKAMPLYDEWGNPRGAVGAFFDITKLKRMEDALCESEVRFRSLVESYAQAVWETDAHGAVVKDSPSWRAYTGQTLDEWLGSGWVDAIHPDDRAFAERQWRETVATKRNLDAEFRLKNRESGWRWTNVRATPILASDGSVTKWSGMNIDIDARKRAEAALQESEDRYRSLFEQIDEGYCIIQVMFDDDGRACDYRFIEANPAFEKQSGFVNAVGRTMRELAPNIESKWFEAYGAIATTGVARRFEDYSAVLEMHFSIYAFRIGAPEDRKVAILFTDVTEAKKSEAALQASEAQFRAMFELTGVGMTQADPATGRLLKVNERLAQMLGYERSELEGVRFSDLTYPDDRAEDWERFSRMARGETRTYDSEKRYVRKDGSVFWIRANATLTGDVMRAGPRTVAVIQDISEQKRIERELRESETRLQMALEAARAGVWELVPATGAFTASPAAMALHGLRPDADINHDTALAAVYEPDRPSVLAALDNSLETGTRFKVELRALQPDGGLRWLSCLALVKGEGKGRRLIGLVQDIDERKRSELALFESELRLKLAAEAGKIGIFDWRVNSGEMVWDGQLRAQWGLPAGAPTNIEAFMQGVHPDDRIKVREAVDRGLDPKSDGAFEIEFRIVGIESRAERWIAAAGRTFFENGRAVRFVGTTKDVTARKRAEAERQKFVSLAEQSMEFIGICGMDFEPLYINPAGLLLVGLESVEDVLRGGVKVSDFFFPEDRDFIFGEFFPRVIREGAANVEIRFRHFKTGAAIWMLYNVFFLRDPDGEPIGLATVSRDITERRRAEDALRDADRRKDEFLATLAHELRNPLAPIRNAVHVLRHDALASPSGKRDLTLLSMIERQVEHLIRLVDDLLEVSRITRGKIELRKAKIDLVDVLNTALEMAQPVIEGGGHLLHVEMPEEPIFVEGDAVRLAQVFTNLLNNAAKYTEQGGSVALSAERRGAEAVVTVRDSGLGIPAEMLPRVFDLFTQVDRTLGRAQGGLGIGLALVRSLLQLHGGSVEAQSEGLGRGSAFVVRLPVIAVSQVEEPMEPAPAGETTRRILVIDDDHDVADSLVMFLEIFGAQVQVAYGGAEGVERVKTFQPDIVFLDLGMPKMDGYETARRIRALPEGRKLTLVALTGWGQEQIHDRARDCGFDRQLTKPAGLEALQDVLAG